MSSAGDKKEARAVADLAQGTIIAVVEIAAPPERVFRALTDPAEVVAWWGSPDTYQTTEWRSDLRVGGAWSAAGRGADGAPFTVGGEFLVVEPPHRLVQTWNPKWAEGVTTTVHYRLDAIPGGTRVTVRHEGFGGHAAVCERHSRGWELVLGWLVGHLVGAGAAAAPAAPTVVPEPPPGGAFGVPRKMKGYVLAVLRKGPAYHTMPPAEVRALMQQHLAFIQRHVEEGRFVFASPVLDDGPWAGVAYVRARTCEDALAMLRDDPGVRAGRFIPEAHPAWAPDLDAVRVEY
jgi:uncharacterized protein YndB with AHSA1/START domain/uncharacterized protein YciI